MAARLLVFPYGDLYSVSAWERSKGGEYEHEVYRSCAGDSVRSIVGRARTAAATSSGGIIIILSRCRSLDCRRSWGRRVERHDPRRSRW
jgi:hypothetical protein